MTSAIRTLGNGILYAFRFSLPFLIDQIVYQYFVNSQNVKPRQAAKVASLAGIAAIWKICPKSSHKYIGGVYLAYKVVHFLYVRSSASSNSGPAPGSSASASASAINSTRTEQTPPAATQLPDSKERSKRYFGFRDQFIIRYSGDVSVELFARNERGFLLQGDSFTSTVYELPGMQPLINTKKELWKEPQIREQFGALFKLFVQDMEIVYQRLEEEGIYAFKQKNPGKEPSDDEKYQEMARFLETSEGENDYDLIRWCDGKNIALPKIYWTARYRLVLITLEKESDNRKDKRTVVNNITNENPDPFVTPGTPEYQWKETYNRIIMKFAPILNNLGPEDPVRKYMVLDDLEETY